MTEARISLRNHKPQQNQKSNITITSRPPLFLSRVASLLNTVITHHMTKTRRNLPRQSVVTALFVLISCIRSNQRVNGKSTVSHPIFGGFLHNRRQLLLTPPKPKPKQDAYSHTTSTLTIHSHQVFPAVLHYLNNSSKWILAVANLIGVWMHKEGPFIVLGCIVASFLTENVLKRVINQGRPKGSPLSDPGMPSSHSLACFFLAFAWMSFLAGHEILFLGLATFVATLRVVCGYHTLAQISVGAVLGSVFGLSWVALGRSVQTLGHPEIVQKVIWFTYVCGSALFIWKIMPKWIPFLNKHSSDWQ